MTTTIRLAEPSDAEAFQETYGPLVEATPISRDPAWALAVADGARLVRLP